MMAAVPVHPWFYLLLGYEAWRGNLLSFAALASERMT